MKIIIGTTLVIIGLVVYALIGQAMIKVLEGSDSYQDAAESAELTRFFVDMLVIVCWPLLLLGMMAVRVLGFVVNGLFYLYYRFKK